MPLIWESTGMGEPLKVFFSNAFIMVVIYEERVRTCRHIP